MSNVKIKANASGTADFTIEAPATNSALTLTLPAETGSLLTNASDIESQVKTATNASGSAPVYACRAWVNFNGTGTVAIRASGNVSSITDNGTGNYTVNFTTAMPDANYCWSGGPSAGSSRGFVLFYDSNQTYSTSALQVTSRAANDSGLQDMAYACVAIFR